MAVKRVFKEALIGASILFVNSDKENEFESISPSFPFNSIDIISLDVSGNPVTPTTGFYQILVKTDVNGGFKTLSSNGQLDATLTGGSLLVDGEAFSIDFIGLPIEIKIVPVGVDVAVSYRVLIKQASDAGIGMPVKHETKSLSAKGLTPITQISAQYGLLNDVLTVTDDAGGGTNSAVDSKFVCSSGTTADGLATILTQRQLANKSGHLGISRFSMLFDTAVALNQQVAGLLNAEDGFLFGYAPDRRFGIIHSHDGKDEHRELTITTAATAPQTAAIEVNGTSFDVPLSGAGATVQDDAFEISEFLDDQVPNYSFSSNNDTVTAQAVIPGPSGDFSFSSDGNAVAEWAQIVPGVDVISDFTPQSEWNINPYPQLNPQTLNEAMIEFNGNVEFYIQDTISSCYVLVHRLKHVNLFTLPHSSNPTFRVGWLSRNVGSTTDVKTQGSHASLFIDGEMGRSKIPRAELNEQSNVGLILTNVMTLRNRTHMNNRVNRADIFPLSVSLATDSAKAAFYEIRLNADFGGNLDFRYIDKAGSLMEVAKDSVSVSGGLLVAAFPILGAPPPIDVERLAALLLPGFTATIAARVSQGAASTMDATMIWQED